MRGSRSLEKLRFLAGMKEFERQNGVRFDREQLAFLQQHGLDLDIPHITFWFEAHFTHAVKDS